MYTCPFITFFTVNVSTSPFSIHTVVKTQSHLVLTAIERIRLKILNTVI